MGKILLVNQDQDLLERVRLGLEDKTGEEILIVRTAREAIGILNKEYEFCMVIRDNQSEVLNFLISQNSTISFLYFPDDINLELPFTSIFLGIWRKNKFSEMCESIGSILRKRHH